MLSLSLLALILPALASASQWNFGIMKGEKVSTNFGNLVARKGSGRWGLVGDDGMDDKTADYFCKMAGYDRAEFYTFVNNSWEKVNMDHKLDILTSNNMDFSIGTVSCNGTSGVYEDDCFSSFETGCCDHSNDPLVLHCTFYSETEVVHGRGHQRNSTTDVANVGSVVLKRRLGDNTTLSSLICPPSGGYHHNVTNAICRESGYTHSDGYTTHIAVEDEDRADCDWIAEHGLNKVTLDIQGCKGDARSLSECSEVMVTTEECNTDNTVVVDCRIERSKLIEFQVLANPDRTQNRTLSSYAAAKGTLVATISDMRTGTTFHSLVSSVADEGQRQNIASAICTQLGYQFGNYSTQREMPQKDKLSCGFIEKHGIRNLVSEYSCPAEDSNPSTGCQYNYDERVWYAGEAMALDCYNN